MGRVYTVEFNAFSVPATNALDFFEIRPAANKVCEVHGVFISNTGIAADAGDAQEELLPVQIIRLPATVTSGLGGATPSGVPLNVNDAAAGFGADTKNTTVATTSGTAVTIHSDGFNVRTGWVYIPTPEMRPRVQNAEALVIRLPTGPADAVTMSGTIYIEEF